MREGWGQAASRAACRLTVDTFQSHPRGNSKALPRGEAWYNPFKFKMGLKRMAMFPDRRDGVN